MELSTYLSELDWVLGQQLLCVEELSAAEMGLAPDRDDANSPSAIVAHTIAVTRAFVVGVVFGGDIDRDRPAEFATRFEDALAAAAAIEELRATLSVLADGSIDLSAEVLPDARTWGSEPDAPMARRQVLAEALRHAAIHLGELRYTRSVLLARRA